MTMELAINNSSKTLSVSDAIFGREFSEDLVHQVVVAYRNAGRSGTTAQKTRSEVNRTMCRSARAAILSERNRQGRITVVESFDIDAPKTKSMIAKLKSLEVGK